MMPAPTLRPTTASDTTGQVNMLLPPASPDAPDAEAAPIELHIDVSLAAMSVSPLPSAAAASARNEPVKAPSTLALAPPAPRLRPPSPTGYARAFPAAAGADVATTGASVASGRRWAPTHSGLFASLAAPPPMTAPMPVVRRPAAEEELHTPLTSPLAMPHLAHAASLDAAARAMGGLLGPPAAPAAVLLARKAPCRPFSHCARCVVSITQRHHTSQIGHVVPRPACSRRGW